jgi:RNA polymerase sigma factor (sigma-70 family)
VAVNLVHRRGRRQRTERTALDRFRPTSSTTTTAAPPEIELWQAVAALPQRQRVAVVLRYLGDLTEAQTAEAMGVAPGTASAALSAARASLSRTLAIEEDGRRDA